MKSKKKRRIIEDPDTEVEPNYKKSGQAPGKTIEARENQLIMLAYDLVEERMKKKTATSQETTQFIKAGSVNAQLEKEKLRKEVELLKAKAEALISQKNMEKMFEEAMVAFRTYSGQEEVPNDC